MRYLVLAGSLPEATQWRFRNDVAWRDVFYVGSAASVEGLRLGAGWIIVRLAGFYGRPDYGRISSVVHDCKRKTSEPTLEAQVWV